MTAHDPVMVEFERRTAVSNGYQSMPMPDEQQIKDGAHILSEILDDAAPLYEHRYRFPAREMLRYAAWLGKDVTPRDAEAETLTMLRKTKEHLATILFALGKDVPGHPWLDQGQKGLDEAKAYLAATEAKHD